MIILFIMCINYQEVFVYPINYHIAGGLIEFIIYPNLSQILNSNPNYTNFLLNQFID